MFGIKYCVLNQLLRAEKRSKMDLSNLHAQFNAMGAFTMLSFDVGYFNTKSEFHDLFTKTKVVVVPSLGAVGVDCSGSASF